MIVIKSTFSRDTKKDGTNDKQEIEVEVTQSSRKFTHDANDPFFAKKWVKFGKIGLIKYFFELIREKSMDSFVVRCPTDI